MLIKEAAARAGVNEMTIRRWIKSGKLQATKVHVGGNEVWQIDDHAELTPPPPTDSTELAKERVRGIEAMAAAQAKEIERLRADNERLMAANLRMMEVHADMIKALEPRKPETQAPAPGFFAKLFGVTK